MAPTTTPPSSQTTGIPEITTSPHSSPSSTSQGTQKHKNQAKGWRSPLLKFSQTVLTLPFMSEYVASASGENHCLFIIII